MILVCRAENKDPFDVHCNNNKTKKYLSQYHVRWVSLIRNTPDWMEHSSAMSNISTTFNRAIGGEPTKFADGTRAQCFGQDRRQKMNPTFHKIIVECNTATLDLLYSNNCLINYMISKAIHVLTNIFYIHEVHRQRDTILETRFSSMHLSHWFDRCHIMEAESVRGLV